MTKTWLNTFPWTVRGETEAEFYLRESQERLARMMPLLKLLIATSGIRFDTHSKWTPEQRWQHKPY